MADLLSVLEVDLGPGIRAGFTRRTPGESVGQYAGLNLGQHVGDLASTVSRNRNLVDGWAGRPVRYVDQVHGARVVRVDERENRADAIVVRRHEAAAIMVADCVPILLADAHREIGAVVHAGRQGLVGGVIEAALGALVGAGAVLSETRAFIGPAVCGRCYEVPPAMHESIAAVLPATASTTSWGTAALDLPAGVVERLGQSGVIDVHRAGGCTLEDEQWFSHRRATRNGDSTGRFAGVLAI